MKRNPLISLFNVCLGLFIILTTIVLAWQVSEAQGADAAFEISHRVGGSTQYLPAIMKPEGPRHKIVFASDYGNLGGNRDIYIMNPDGTGLVNLTNTPDVIENFPVWSPDGTKIAYEYEEEFSDTIDIFIMDADGTNKINVSHAPGKSSRFAEWAPNSQQLVFASDRDDASGVYDIFVVNRDGSGLDNLTNSNDRSDLDPHWSADSTKIVFTSDISLDPAAINYISTVNADGSDKTDLYTDINGGNFAPRWIPNDSKISFMRQFGTSCLFTMNPDGSDAICTIEFTTVDYVSTYEWNSTGSQMLLFLYPDPFDDTTYLVNYDVATENMVGFASNIWREQYGWSSNDSQVVYAGPNPVGSEIFTANSDGTDKINVTESLNSKNYAPDWSPVPIP